MTRTWKISSDDRNAVISYDDESTTTTFLGLFNLGQITLGQLQVLERLHPMQTSITEEAEMFVATAGEMRKIFPDAGKGQVGFIPVNIAPTEYMTLLVSPVPTSMEIKGVETFELWWIHLKIE